jgi:hypothetical protein
VSAYWPRALRPRSREAETCSRAFSSARCQASRASNSSSPRRFSRMRVTVRWARAAGVTPACMPSTSFVCLVRDVSFLSRRADELDGTATLFAFRARAFGAAVGVFVFDAERISALEGERARPPLAGTAVFGFAVTPAFAARFAVPFAFAPTFSFAGARARPACARVAPILTTPRFAFVAIAQLESSMPIVLASSWIVKTPSSVTLQNRSTAPLVTANTPA